MRAVILFCFSLQMNIAYAQETKTAARAPSNTNPNVFVSVKGEGAFFSCPKHIIDGLNIVANNQEAQVYGFIESATRDSAGSITVKISYQGTKNVEYVIQASAGCLFRVVPGKS